MSYDTIVRIMDVIMVVTILPLMILVGMFFWGVVVIVVINFVLLVTGNEPIGIPAHWR